MACFFWTFLAGAACAAGSGYTKVAATVFDLPAGRAVANLNEEMRLETLGSNGGWTEIQIDVWIHVSALKGIPSPGEKLQIGAGMGIRVDSFDGPTAGKIFRGSTPTLLEHRNDYVVARISGWIKSADLKPGKGARKAESPAAPAVVPQAVRGPAPATAGQAISDLRSEAAPPPEYGKHIAASIGVGSNAGIHLPRASENAARFKQEFETRGFSPVFLLTDTAATRKGIESLLAGSLAESSSENARVVVYFSGRAVTTNPKTGGQKGFILPSDGLPEDYISSAISVARLRELVDLVPGRTVVFLIDACLTDAGVDKTYEPFLPGLGRHIDLPPGPRAVKIVSACVADAAGEDASDKPKSSSGRVDKKTEKPYVETHGGLGLEMVYVPGGTFERDGGQEVTVDGVWMSKYEITVGQFRNFLSETGLGFDWTKNSFGDFGVSQYAPTDNCPMINVNWHHATEFAAWLSAKTGMAYRLPTDAEWEWAARGGKNFEYATASGEIGKNLANCLGCGSPWDDRRTAPVGSFPPNPLGIHDLSGNVWEWCADWHDAYPAGKQKNPKGPKEGGRKVARGGSWNNPPALVRAAHRGSVKPGYRSQYMGFRIVATKK